MVMIKKLILLSSILLLAVPGWGQTASDNFTCASPPCSLSSNWTTTVVGFSIYTANEVESVRSGQTLAHWNASSFPANQSVQATVGMLSAGSYTGPAARVGTGSDTGYDCVWNSLGLYLRLHNSGTDTTLQTGSAPNIGDVIKIVPTGTTISCTDTRSSTVIQTLSVTDTTLSSGQPGIGGYGNGVGTLLGTWTASGSSTVSILTNRLPLGDKGFTYSSGVPFATMTAVNGTAPYTWSISSGSLPTGFSLSSGGVITGTATNSGSFTVTLKATDSASNTASKSFTFTVFEQPLDQYGGLTNKPCTGGSSGYFYTAEIDNRWVFCDPLGNEFWMLGIQNMVLDTSVPNQGVSYVQIVGSKYPSSTVWGTQAMFRAQSWGFNTSADYGVDYVQTFGSGSVSMPATNIFNWALYSFTNNGGYGSGPVKDLMHCINTNALALPNGDLPDVFDPNFDAYVNGRLAATANDSYYKNWLTSPWMVGGSSDDTDYLMGFGPGLEVPGVDGVVHPHIGLLSLAVSPTESSDSTWGQTYTNTTVYSKQQLQTYLKSVYSSIAALNASWGSDYTTFGSAGGWPKATTGGTGLMDEDGSSSWLGSNAGTLSGATAGVTTDLDNFLYLWAKQYFSVERTRFKQYAPNLLFMGPNTMNSHTGLTRSQILQAAGQYCDVIQAGVTTQPLLNLTAQYAGNVPILQWFGATANADSSLWRYTGPSCCDQGTQAARGTYYSNGISFLVGGTVAATGIMPVVGIKWWAWVDGWSEKANWGLVSFRDNAYDGLEAVTAQGADSWGYTTTSPYVTTGGEERNYGDFLDSVTTGNLNALRTLVSDP